MNHDKLREVAAAIELEPEAFDMETWLHGDATTLCGTIGCIAGTTVRLDAVWMAEHAEMSVGYGLMIDDSIVADDARKMLGLDYVDPCNDHPLFVSGYWWQQACKHLGLPIGPVHHLNWISPKHAATVLYALADGTITLDQFEYWKKEGEEGQ
jgi:hypothetical protein